MYGVCMCVWHQRRGRGQRNNSRSRRVTCFVRRPPACVCGAMVCSKPQLFILIFEVSIARAKLERLLIQTNKHTMFADE